jgi:putative intracellular protease/amidase
MDRGGLSSLRVGETVLVALSAARSVDLSNNTGGVSGFSFMQAVDILREHSVRVAIATPNGATPEFYSTDEAVDNWLKHNRELYADPLAINEIAKQDNVMGYCGLLLPSSLGGVSDLANDVALGSLVRKFTIAKKPICAIGYGVTGLCKAFNENDKWCFSSWNLTAISNFEVARFPFFSKLPLIIEDFIKDNGGYYNCSDVDEMHVIVDRTLVTGQNDNSTALAVQNFIWLALKSSQ